MLCHLHYYHNDDRFHCDQGYSRWPFSASSEARNLPSAGDDTAVNLSPLRFRRHARLAATQNLPVLSGFWWLGRVRFCLELWDFMSSFVVSTLAKGQVLCLA